MIIFLYSNDNLFKKYNGKTILLLLIKVTISWLKNKNNSGIQTAQSNNSDSCYSM